MSSPPSPAEIFNLAQKCLSVITQYLLISEAPAAKRLGREFKEGARNSLHGFGYQQALRLPLQLIVEQSLNLPPVRHFRAVDAAFIREWDAWSDNTSDLLFHIARDLWTMVQHCERDCGVEEAWVPDGMHVGRLYEELRDEWRFRDVPIDLLARYHHEEWIEWKRSLGANDLKNHEPIGPAKSSSTIDVPQTQAGYLGITLNQEQRTASRSGFEIPVHLSDRPWNLLVRLFRAESTGVSVDELKRGIHSADAMKQGISALRSKLIGLGLGISDGRANKNRVLISTSEISDDDVSVSAHHNQS